MRVSARKLGGALVILLILILFASAAFNVLAAGHGRSAVGDRPVTILTVLFAAGALAPFINLFAVRRGLHATVTLLLVVVAAGSLCLLFVTAAPPDEAGASGLNALSSFWLIMVSGLLLVFPLSCGKRRPDEEDVLSGPMVSVSLFYAAAAAACILAMAAFGAPSQACGRLASRLPALGLVLTAVGLILVILRCRSGVQGLASLLCLSLAPPLLLAACCLMPADQERLSAVCLYRAHAFWAGAAGCLTALAAAGRRYFTPLRSQRVYHYAAAAALCAVTLASLGRIGASGKAAGKPAPPDPCAGEPVEDRKLPLAPGGYCLQSLQDPSSFIWIDEPGETRLTALRKKIGPALDRGIGRLAIRVSTPGGEVRAVIFDLVTRSTEPGSDACASIEVLRFPWQPPAEEIDLPLTFPLCPGAEMWAGEDEDCRRVVVGKAPPEHPTGGGGCKSPSRFTLLPLSLDSQGPFLAADGKKGPGRRIPGIAAIEAEVWKHYTVGQRIGSALILVLDPEEGGTLQDLVDLITMLRWRNVPVVDLLWIKGWETPGD